MKSLKKIHDYLQSQYPEYKSSMEIADAINDESRSVARKLLSSENIVQIKKGHKYLYKYKDELMVDYCPVNPYTERLNFRLSNEVTEIIRDRAQEQGLTMTEYIRQMIPAEEHA